MSDRYRSGGAYEDLLRSAKVVAKSAKRWECCLEVRNDGKRQE
jgi:hypothetical protein